MHDHDDSLFAEENWQRNLVELLSGDKAGRTSIAYVGRSLEQGRMDAVALADGLKGTARFINRVGELCLGTHDELRLEVEGEPRSGSLEIFVRFAHELIGTVDAIADSKFLTGLAIIFALTGFNPKDAGKSLLTLFKKLKGRPIDDETDLKAALPDDLPIETAELIRIFNDQEVQAAIRAALRPLREEGVETFETRVDQKAVETVSKEDVIAADAAEIAAIINTEDKVLDVQKASFVPHLAWHLSDRGKPFDAQIEDPVLWDHIAAGDRFGFGDRLHVTLHTEAEREANGRLRVTRTVTKVHLIERGNGLQIPLPLLDSGPDAAAN